MYRYFGLMLISLCTFSLSAQINWHKLGDPSISETGTSVIQMPGGEVFYLSVTDVDSLANKDIAVHRLDANGNVIWQKFYGTDGNEFANRICFLDDHVYVGGFTERNAEIDIFLLKLDKDGKQIWWKEYGQLNTSEQVHDVQATADGFLVMAGTAKQTQFNYSNLYAIKIDTAGNKAWDYYDQDTVNVVGNAVRSLPSGSLAFASDRQGQHGFDVGCTFLDKDGNFIWRKAVSSGHNRGSKNLIINSDFQLAIAGEGETDKSLYFEVSLTLVDTLGNIVQDVFTPGSTFNDAAFAIDQLDNGKYILSGYTININLGGITEMFLMVIDSAGTIFNNYSFCHSISCIGYDIKVLPGNTFIAAGTDLNSAKNLIFVSGSSVDLLLSQLKVLPRSLYPNPARINEELRFDGFERGHFKIFDIRGQLISQGHYPEDVVKVGVQGIFTLQFTSQEGSSHWFKLVVQ